MDTNLTIKKFVEIENKLKILDNYNDFLSWIQENHNIWIDSESIIYMLTNVYQSALDNNENLIYTLNLIINNKLVSLLFDINNTGKINYKGFMN